MIYTPDLKLEKAVKLFKNIELRNDIDKDLTEQEDLLFYYISKLKNEIVIKDNKISEMAAVFNGIKRFTL